MSFVSFAVAAACVLANVVAIAALVMGWRSSTPRVYAVRAAIGGALLVPVGLLGTVLGLRLAFAAVGGSAPENKASLLAQGISEAMNSTAFTIAGSLVPFAVAIALYLKRPRAGAGNDPAPSA